MSDSLTTYLSWAAVVIALAAAVLGYLAFSA